MTVRLSCIAAVFTCMNLAGCSPSPVTLPSTGRIYVEVNDSRGRRLEPVADTLVLIRRYQSCPGNKWLFMEASTTGIDAYLTRSSASGYYAVPPKTQAVSCAVGVDVTALGRITQAPQRGIS